ncbi:MAG: ATP synthase subunit I [Methylovulum sp.]|uniref:ATP synthase subunit I n=1 Tax=Methylovulum sp. TaxID=1916980 RepID=UPI002623D463|nr:ATP synthase subunit I [Methylovulum sp.]MDD2722485.1 ATP synthase subunit I [Methylovulum sp.]MDD5125327.1 ATP synthase subunit I [Methylovulum sp.]
MTDRSTSTVSKVLIYQLLIIIIGVVSLAVMGEWQKATSFTYGGLIAFLPNLFFAIQIHKATGKEARKILNAFYLGEVGKWVLTVILFVVVFNLPNIEIFSLLCAYALAISVFWFALLMR